MINLALVGIGYWASHTADEVMRSKKVNLYKVFTRTVEKREEFARKYNCLTAASYEEILGDPDVDGIILETPNYVHKEQLIIASRFKKAVLVDKPICNTLLEGRAIFEAYERSGNLLAVGHNSRRRPESRIMKKMIEEGKIGKVVAIDSVLSTPRGLSFKGGEWRGEEDKCPGGPLLQLAVHHADTLSYLLGPITEVSSFQANLFNKAETVDTTATLIRFASGSLGYIGSCYNTVNTYQIVIYGTEGKVTYSDTDGLWVWDIVGNKKEIDLGNKNQVAEAILEEIEEFGESIEGRRKPETGIAEGLHSLAIIRAAILSQEKGVPVSPLKLLKKHQIYI